MIAVIDLGTNTFNLVVGENSAHLKRIVFQHSLAVGLGKGGIQHDRIADDAFERGLQAFTTLHAMALKQGAQRILAIGTSALRNASNGDAFVKAVQESSGITIRIIDGQEEAQLIWEGVRQSGALGSKAQLLIDIGGGSVEFIICTDRQLLWKKSLEIGMARINALYPLPDPLDAAILAQVDTCLREKTEEIYIALKQYQVDALIGSAGSFDTLSELDANDKYQHYMWAHSPAWELSRDDFNRHYHTLLLATREERAALPGMLPIRVDMIVYAVVLIRLLADRLQSQYIVCSRYALREGVLFSTR